MRKIWYNTKLIGEFFIKDKRKSGMCLTRTSTVVTVCLGEACYGYTNFNTNTSSWFSSCTSGNGRILLFLYCYAYTIVS